MATHGPHRISASPFGDRLTVGCTGMPFCPDDCTITIVGPLRLGSTDPFRSITDLVLEADVRDVTLDLAGVSEVDPAGLAVIVSLARRLRARGGSLSFAAISPVCTAAFDRLQLFSRERNAFDDGRRRQS